MAAMQAKRAATDAVTSDAKMLSSVTALKTSLEHGAQLLRASSGTEVEGVTGRGEFVKLAESYEARAKMYQQISELLKAAQALEAPSASPQERDAMTMVQVANISQIAKEKTVEGVGALKQRVSLRRRASGDDHRATMMA